MLKKTVFTNHRSDVIHPDYRNRVSLAGNISSGDCSINISRIRREDQNTYDLQLREPGQRSPTVGTKINVSVSSMFTFLNVNMLVKILMFILMQHTHITYILLLTRFNVFVK